MMTTGYFQLPVTTYPSYGQSSGPGYSMVPGYPPVSCFSSVGPISYQACPDTALSLAIMIMMMMISH